MAHTAITKAIRRKAAILGVIWHSGTPDLAGDANPHGQKEQQRPNPSVRHPETDNVSPAYGPVP